MMKFMLPFICLQFALILIPSHAQDQSGFISIDCGLSDTGGYNDTITGIHYVSDKNYIVSGVNRNLPSDYVSSSVFRHLWTLRSFPYGARNCYTLTPVQWGEKHLIRATFMHGGYEGQTTSFDLYLGVEFWDTVSLSNSTSIITKEIIHVPSSDYIHVCLVNSGGGIPFISALELRTLIQSSFNFYLPGTSLISFRRWNFAPASPDKVIRFPDDSYDRLWWPYPTPPSLVEMSTTRPLVRRNEFDPPMSVIRTAVASQSVSVPLSVTWTPPDPTLTFYVVWSFAELTELKMVEYRAFTVNLNGQPWNGGLVIVPDRALKSLNTYRSDTSASYNFSLVSTRNSTLPPLVNALEIYTVKLFLQSQTYENDVRAILNIKSAYRVKRDNWQGDPCFPREFTWDGLDCIVPSNASTPSRIKSLNLSSSGLTGNVSSYLAHLAFLENLDLSNNRLTGQVPDFLAELPQLKFLNLSGNQFSGSLPQKLIEKANHGLELRVDELEKKKSNKFVVPVVIVSLTALLVVLAIVIVTVCLKRGKKSSAKSTVLAVRSFTVSKSVPVLAVRSVPHKNDGFWQTKNMHFTYSDILNMTNNFQRIIGKGGFGTVYHGTTTDGKEIAVKLLSQSSAQGYSEFQTEAELLTRVHHRNVTILVGYCHEGSHMALVYEYMANGTLREHLSGHDIVLNWSERLRILLDAAQGLDYLHNGCQPPIIHRDIKSTNMLINENLEAKLADFGLSRAYTIDEGSYVSTRVVGTPGYLDPEYYETQRLHEKSDIYSFGVVMLEVITGRLVISGTNQDRRHIVYRVSHLLDTGADVASIADPKLKGFYDVKSVWNALEMAMAWLDYLHNGCQPPIIHRDIKSTNLLINENSEAKLADFGLSRAYTIDEGSYVSTRVVGTPGYLDPEYYETQRLHEKSDIYSFGVVMLEVITGRPVISGTNQDRRHIVYRVSHLLDTGADVASIADPKMRGCYDAKSVWKALEMAMTCVSLKSLNRPNIANVLAELKDCLVSEKSRSEDESYTQSTL